MNMQPISTPRRPDATDARSYDRLARTRTFQDGGFDAWSRAVLGIVGAGMIGARLAREAVLSGVREVRSWDFDRTERANQGNQFGKPGVLKIVGVTNDCDAIRTGHARGFPVDVRHAGIRMLAECDVLIDCTDDPALAWPLTEISNGLGRPLLRAAVDGSGQLELGRVLCSAARPESACQLCTLSVDDLTRHTTRTGCQNALQTHSPPTLAGGAIGGAVASLTLLQAQRLVTGNDVQRVLDREIILDWTNFQLFELTLQRSGQCLSGHQRWQLIPIDTPVDQTSWLDLSQHARRETGGAEVQLSPYLHPLCREASCRCTTTSRATGTSWATPPDCPSCGQPMQWLKETQQPWITHELATESGILHQPLSELGIPPGAMVLAKSPGKPLVRLLLA